MSEMSCSILESENKFYILYLCIDLFEFDRANILNFIVMMQYANIQIGIEIY